MAWIAALISGVAGGGLSSLSGKAGKKAGKKAAAERELGYNRASGAMDPYLKGGTAGFNSLAELMGLEGYRTKEERALNDFLGTNPSLGTAGLDESTFEKYSKYGPLGFILNKQADMGGGPKIKQMPGLQPGTTLGRTSGKSPANIPGPLKDVLGARAKSKRKQAAAQAGLQAQYDIDNAAWEARKKELSDASEQSLVGYDPMAALKRTPGYQARYTEGLNTAQNSMAGSLLGGNALRGLTDYGQTYASNEYNNEFNRRAALAGIGQNAATSVGNWATGFGSDAANLSLQQGRNEQNMYSNMNNVLQGSLENYMQYKSRPKSDRELYGYTR